MHTIKVHVGDISSKPNNDYITLETRNVMW